MLLLYHQTYQEVAHFAYASKLANVLSPCILITSNSQTLCKGKILLDCWLLVAGRQSTTALDRRIVSRNQSTSRSLDLGPVNEEEAKRGNLGMTAELAAWWGEQGGAGGMEGDPLQGWLGREQQARAVYKRYIVVLYVTFMSCEFIACNWKTAVNLNFDCPPSMCHLCCFDLLAVYMCSKADLYVGKSNLDVRIC